MRSLRWVGCLLLALAGPAQAACAGPGAWPQRLAPGAWWVAGAPGDSDAGNRGATSNLLAVRDGARLWLVGAGGTPAQGRRLACALRAVGAGEVTDLVLSWPRGELTLGASAFPRARRWAHDEVAAAMQARCPRCRSRMAERLGAAAADLGPDPIRLPTDRLRGAQGQLGPFDWQLAHRSDETAVLLLHWRGSRLWLAHGLLWGEGPPDLRDADPLVMRPALASWLANLPDDARVLPEQGDWLSREAALAQAAYLGQLVDAVDAALRRGDLVTDPMPELPWAGHPRQGLNWQRSWSLREPVVF